MQGANAEKNRPRSKEKPKNKMKHFFSSMCYSILLGVYPEIKTETLHFVQDDKRRVQDDLT
jgi:hypothetical protein